MIIKTSKYREDMLEEVMFFSNVIRVDRTYSTRDEKHNILDMLKFYTNYQEDKANLLCVKDFDKIAILNDDGKKIYTFISYEK